MPVIFTNKISTLDVRYPDHFCVKRDHLSAANILVPCFPPPKQHIFARGNSPSENAKANTGAATINTNFMLDFEQKIQHCYRNQFFVPKDMCKKNFHRNCLQRNKLSWFETTLTSKKTHLPGILNCRHFDPVCFYGATSFSRGNHASELDHAESFCRCIDLSDLTLRMRIVTGSP